MPESYSGPGPVLDQYREDLENLISEDHAKVWVTVTGLISDAALSSEAQDLVTRFAGLIDVEKRLALSLMRRRINKERTS